MKHVNYTNIYKTLRKSYDSNLYEPVNDDWHAGFDCFGRAVLFNDYYEIRTGVLCGCSSMTDKLKFATSLLLEDFLSKPWMDLTDDEHDAFSSATSYHAYGEKKGGWMMLFDLPEERMEEIWRMAFWFTAEGKAPKNWRDAT